MGNSIVGLAVPRFPGKVAREPAEGERSAFTGACLNLALIRFCGFAMPQIYLDCDGVLADFDAGAARVLGMMPQAYRARFGLPRFWAALERAPDFYARLPPIKDARVLYDGVRHLDPIILTGCPRGGWAEAQKERWVAAHFPGTRIITCMAADKRRFCARGDILVDDSLKFQHLWEEAGGVFIYHRSAAETLSQLAEHLEGGPVDHTEARVEGTLCRQVPRSR